ncbi:DUF4870 domain-containing protein [Methanotrichaceae archaeon M04Ac]|uniref:DUF4870 domain-containing protein n=1 Tax=Candidatus Methanocrinis alkalitolerans TaxID=3033395 RepID=A0ABT5XFJ9_9EURY|nr:DUF4870 domain-containing protein [Candidatus Methanocrinis alkalitolerans]MCR3884563.1 DUF4870 domain-containing protein [Methanothrix sp.]MDF0593497.1 DUF4870 domain-containing protein [Candidatus Methanocrinis alkalitolerans]
MIEENRDARTWAVLCHLSALVMLLGVPLGNVLGPLVVWLVKRNDHQFIDDQGREALNFQLSITLYWVLAGVLIFFSAGSIAFFWPAFRYGMMEFWNPIAMPIAMIFGLFLIFGLLILDVVLAIAAAVRASDGVPYRYPLTIRAIK